MLATLVLYGTTPDIALMNEDMSSMLVIALLTFFLVRLHSRSRFIRFGIQVVRVDLWDSSEFSVRILEDLLVVMGGSKWRSLEDL